MYKAKNTEIFKVFKNGLKFLLWAILIFVVVLFAQCAYESSYRIIFGKASYSVKASYKLPNSNTEIILERRCIHLFLAEYERTLVLHVAGKEVLRQEVAADSGGYSRMNVYQVSPTEYFLSGDISYDKHELDITIPKITANHSEGKPTGARFVGAFDSDEKKVWRFIAKTEREEQKSKIERKGGI